MDYLRQIEDDLNSLGLEAKKKYPEVKDACERSLSTLKTIREMYVSEMMRKSASEKEKSQIKFPQSSDISAPYILACNYANAEPKLITMALVGIQLLLNYDIIPPADVKNILRVLNIQASSGRSDCQMKLLQILLQLANSLTQNTTASSYLTESTVCSFLTLSLQLCDTRSNVSVSSTAFATARQILALVLDGVKEVFGLNGDSRQPCTVDMASALTASITLSAQLLLKDVMMFIRGQPGEWLRGIVLSLPYSLDLLHDALSGWKTLFQTIPPFQLIVRERICPALRPLLKGLQDDFVVAASRSGVPAAATMTSRVVRIARSLLLDFVHPAGLLDELDLIISLMVHSLLPDRGLGGASIRPPEDSALKGVHGMALNIGKALNVPSGVAVHNPNAAGATARNSLLSGNHFLALASTPAYSGGGTHLLSSPASTSVHQIPSHPAGACLETLLSFFLSNIPDELARCQGCAGCMALGKAMTTTLISVTALLSAGLGVESNAKEFDSIVRGSQLITLLEGVLTGTETDVEYVVKSIHEQLVASASIDGPEVLVLSFHVMQVVVRLMVKLSLLASPGEAVPLQPHSGADPSEAPSRPGAESCHGVVFFQRSAVQALLSTTFSAAKREDMLPAITAVCDNTFDSVQEACGNLLARVEYTGIVRRSLGILAELALTSGFLGLRRPCGLVISSLCKFTVPAWRGQEMQELGEQQQQSSAPITELTMRWRHIQAQVRLLQVVALLADIIPDWDTVVDALDQLYRHFLLSRGALSDEVTSVEGDKVFAAIERFKFYSTFLSDEALMKLMSSLVALSMNNLAVSAVSGGSNVVVGMGQAASDPLGGSSTSTSATVGWVLPDSLRHPEDQGVPLAEGAVGHISFALRAVVDVAKFNCFRMSRVWQMVTSHLRMVASLKAPRTRAVAVQATLEVINAALDHVPSATIAASDVDSSGEDSVAVRATADAIMLSDEIIFNLIMPSFDGVFIGRAVHRKAVQDRATRQQQQRSSDEAGSATSLSQQESLQALIALAGIQHDDVREELIRCLFEMLQERGHLLTVGWNAVVEIIACVPQSLVDADHLTLEDLVASAESLSRNGSGVDIGGGDGHSAGARTSDSQISSTQVEQQQQQQQQQQTGAKWSRPALVGAFNCAKFIVDEFLELLSIDCVKSLIACLFLFAAQLVDVNMSLTAVEMLWKVCDSTLTRSRARPGAESNEIMSSVLEAMMQRLLLLSMDGRPELRNCAMNTLFAATTANAVLISGQQWRQLFDRAIFPLFDRARARSDSAMSSKEEAKAPELKKGVKMAVHHSRDTAHKQWSETRSLALRGLARVVRTCTRLLLMEPWFRQTWTRALAVCKVAIQEAAVDIEVALAGVDVLFSMLKTVKVAALTVAPAPSPVAAFGSRTLPSSSSGSELDKDKGRVGRRAALESRFKADAVVGAASNTIAGMHSIDTSLGHIDGVDAVATESARQSLWQLCWQTVGEAGQFSAPSLALALHMSRALASSYTDGLDGEFRYSENIRVLLEIVVVLSRPRIAPGDYATGSTITPRGQDRAVEVQLQRSVMTLLRSIKLVDILAIGALSSALAEICFSAQVVQMASPFEDDPGVIYMAPCPEKLRAEAGAYLIELLRSRQVATESSSPTSSGTIPTATVTPTLPKGSSAAVIDIIFRRFVSDICSPSVDARKSSQDRLRFLPESIAGMLSGSTSAVAVQGDGDVATGSRGSAQSGVGGFLSSWGMMWGSGGTATTPAKKAAAPGLGAGTPSRGLHKLDHAQLPSGSGERMGSGKQNPNRTAFQTEQPIAKLDAVPPESIEGGNAWCGFLRMDTEADLLLAALQCESAIGDGSSRSNDGIRGGSISSDDGGAGSGSASGSSSSSSSGSSNSRMSAPSPVDVSAQQQASPPILSEAVWNAIVQAATCTISPWRRCEVEAHAVNSHEARQQSANSVSPEEEELYLQRVGSLIDYMFSQDLHCRLHNRSVDEVSSPPGSPSPSRAPIVSAGVSHRFAAYSYETQLGLVAKVRKRLVSIINSNTSPTLKERALLAYLLITRDMSHVCLRALADGFGGGGKDNRRTSALPDDFFYECNLFLLFLMEIDSTAAILPPRFDCLRGPVGLGSVIDDWLEAGAFEAAPVSLVSASLDQVENLGGGANQGASHVRQRSRSDSASTAASSASTGLGPAGPSSGEPMQLLAKGHLLLFTPLAIRLAACSHPQLRDTASEIIRFADLPHFVNSFRDLVARTEALETENKMLRNELYTVKSAATLPF